MRRYIFMLHFKDGRKPVQYGVLASNPLAAFQTWCALSSVQDVSEDEIREVVITSEPEKRNER